MTATTAPETTATTPVGPAPTAPDRRDLLQEVPS